MNSKPELAGKRYIILRLTAYQAKYVQLLLQAREDSEWGQNESAKRQSLNQVRRQLNAKLKGSQ